MNWENVNSLLSLQAELTPANLPAYGLNCQITLEQKVALEQPVVDWTFRGEKRNMYLHSSLIRGFHKGSRNIKYIFF